MCHATESLEANGRLAYVHPTDLIAAVHKDFSRRSLSL